MKKLLKLFLLIYAVTRAVTHAVCTESPESVAISQIIRDFYVKNSDRFDFIIFGLETRKLKDFVNDVLTVTSDVSPYKLIEVKNDAKRVGVKQSAILLFDDWESYDAFHARVRLTTESPRKFNFLVYIDDWEPMQSIQDTEQPLMLSQESFIHKGLNGSINLLTFSKFQQPNCKLWSLSNVNKFLQAEGKWERSEFFIEKYNNFNGCEINVTNGLLSGTCDYDGYHKIDEECNDFCIQMNEEIGRNLNFTSRYEPIFKDEAAVTDVVEIILRNEHAVYSSSLRLLKLKHPDPFSISNLLNENFIATHPFTTTEIFILISRDVPYTQFEKLFLPFEVEVWIWLIAAMSTGVLTILIVKLAPKKVQNFVFGDGLSTPFLNFIIVIYGLGMIRLPRRSFARFLLMCFILFCLIFRTAYQAKQFEFLTKEMRRPDVKTINDLIEQNFTFCTNEVVMFMIRDMEPFTRINFRNLKIDDSQNGAHIDFHPREMRKLLKRLLSDGSKTAVVIDSSMFQLLFNDAEGQIEFMRLEESIITDHMAFILPRKSFMMEPFNRKLMQMNEAGISEEIVKRFEKHFYVEPPDEHVVLTLTHLGFGFYIWLGCLGIASTIFSLEKLLGKFLSIAYSFIMRKITVKIRRNLSYVDRSEPTAIFTDA